MLGIDFIGQQRLDACLPISWIYLAKFDGKALMLSEVVVNISL
jgi:hypothetical protein